mgnify:FL=1
MDWLHQIPANWLWSGGFVLAAIAYAARAEIMAGLAFVNPFQPNKTGGSSRAALDLALTLKDHFSPDSVGRAAQKQVISAISEPL